jgi:hypothetical protein
MDYWELARSSFHYLRVEVFEVTDSGLYKENRYSHAEAWEQYKI